MSRSSPSFCSAFVKLECRRCKGECWIPTAPMEPCDEMHRSNARLCRECWDKAQDEYRKFTQPRKQND